MRVYLKDGTTIECEDFRAVDAGVLLFGPEEPAEGSDEDAGDERGADGFIPLSELTGVLSEEFIRQVEGPQEAPPQQQRSGEPRGRGQHRAGDIPGPGAPQR